jgi:hypothetical protein
VSTVTNCRAYGASAGRPVRGACAPAARGALATLSEKLAPSSNCRIFVCRMITIVASAAFFASSLDNLLVPTR